MAISYEKKRRRNTFEGKRYVIRDIESKKTKYKNYKKLEFDYITAAKNIYKNLGSFNKEYYEIYDKYEQEVVKV